MHNVGFRIRPSGRMFVGGAAALAAHAAAPANVAHVVLPGRPQHPLGPITFLATRVFLVSEERRNIGRG